MEVPVRQVCPGSYMTSDLKGNFKIYWEIAMVLAIINVINYALQDVLLRISVGLHLHYLISEFKWPQCALNCLHSGKAKPKRKKASANVLTQTNHPNWILVFFWCCEAMVNGWRFLHIISLRDQIKTVISAYLGSLSWKHAIKIGPTHLGPIFPSECAEHTVDSGWSIHSA